MSSYLSTTWRCRFQEYFCSRFNPCNRCEKLKDLELKKAELEMEERVLESSARAERLRAKANAEAYAAMGEVIAEHPGKVFGGLAATGLIALGISALVNKKKR